MTEKKEDILLMLDNLRALSKKKKFRLARPEHDEAVKTLSAVCLGGLEGIKTALEVLPDFPSNTGAEVVAGNWTEISAYLEEFYKTLQTTRYKTELGKRLRLLIGQRLSSNAPEVAMEVIFDVCKDMKPAKKELPTSKDLSLIASTLLADGVSVLKRLPLESGALNKSVQLVSFCLGAGLSLGEKGKSLTTLQTQLSLIRWANLQPKFLNLSKEIQVILQARIRNWDEDLLKLLRSELDSLQPPLRDPINSVLGEITGNQPQVGGEVTESSVSNKEVGQSERTADESTLLPTDTGRDSRATDDALTELEHLMNYIKNINMVLNRKTEEAVRLDRDLRQAEVELKGALKGKEEVQRRCLIIEGKLAESLEYGKKLEDRANSCEGQIENLKSKLVSAENRFKETVKSHNALTDMLSKRIAEEGDHRLTAFRNKLAGMFRSIVVNLKEARSMEMTPELGTALRIQLGQMINMMKSQGIPFDGEDS